MSTYHSQDYFQIRSIAKQPTRMMHTGLGRAYPLHIEYIHIGAALAVIQDILNEAILSHPRLPLPRKIAITKALNKVIWIQNDLFTKWYVHDGEEFTDGMDFGVIEKEGWLHGKRVLHHEKDGNESEGSDDTASPSGSSQTKERDGVKVGVCPFTGVTAAMGNIKVHGEKLGAETKPETVQNEQ